MKASNIVKSAKDRISAIVWPRNAVPDPQTELRTAKELGKPRAVLHAETLAASVEENELPDDVAEAKAAIEQADEARRKAEARLLAAVARNDHVIALRERVRALEGDVTAGTNQLAWCQEQITQKVATLAEWPRNNQALSLCTGLVWIERFAQFLPAWITERKQSLAAARAELEQAESAN